MAACHRCNRRAARETAGLGSIAAIALS